MAWLQKEVSSICNLGDGISLVTGRLGGRLDEKRLKEKVAYF